MNSEQSDREHVLIVGGGVSGLTCALELLERGYLVTIVESENRVGGKVFTQKLGTECFDLGAVLTRVGDDKHYRELLRYARQLNAPLVENEFLDITAKFSSFDKAPYVLPANRVKEGKLIESHFPKNDEIGYSFLAVPGSILSESIPDFLAKLNISDNVYYGGIFYWHCGYGYMTDDSIPALNYVRFLDITGPNDHSLRNLSFKYGFQDLPDKMAMKVRELGGRILLSTHTTKISRKTNSTDSSCSSVEMTCVEQPSGEQITLSSDKLIITCPSPQIADALDVSTTDEERMLMKDIEYVDYCSFLIEFNELPVVPDQTWFYFGSFESVPVGSFVGYFQRYPTTPIAVFCSYKTAKMTMQFCIRKIEEDIRKLHGNHIRIVKVHTQRQWPYMPHYKKDNIDRGHYQLFESIQGQNNTFYCGSLLNGEFVEANIQYAQQLIRTRFGSSKSMLLDTKLPMNAQIKDFLIQKGKEYVDRQLQGIKNMKRVYEIAYSVQAFVNSVKSYIHININTWITCT